MPHKSGELQMRYSGQPRRHLRQETLVPHSIQTTGSPSVKPISYRTNAPEAKPMAGLESHAPPRRVNIMDHIP